MAWKKVNSTPEQVAEELKLNLQDKTDNARVLILGTETEEGYRMSMTIKNPEAVAGIIFTHGIKTGELAEAEEMCDALECIAKTARLLIHDEVRKRKINN